MNWLSYRNFIRKDLQKKVEKWYLGYILTYLFTNLTKIWSFECLVHLRSDHQHWSGNSPWIAICKCFEVRLFDKKLCLHAHDINQDLVRRRFPASEVAPRQDLKNRTIYSHFQERNFQIKYFHWLSAKAEARILAWPSLGQAKCKNIIMSSLKKLQKALSTTSVHIECTYQIPKCFHIEAFSIAPTVCNLNLKFVIFRMDCRHKTFTFWFTRLILFHGTILALWKSFMIMVSLRRRRGERREWSRFF